MRSEATIYDVQRYSSARELPTDWDELATSVFQERAFLVHNEQHNPCRQRYYVLQNDSTPLAAAVVYTLSVDLFTFSQIPSPVKMTVIGLPVSVSASGIFGVRTAIETLLQHLLQIEKGLVVGLNLDPALSTGKGIHMRMLPTIEMVQRFNHWEEYQAQLRTHYRRRIRRLEEKFQHVRRKETACNHFTRQHHRLYLEVVKKSTTKLETLSCEYFAALPDTFSLTTYYLDDEILCWHVNCLDKKRDTLYFFFGGNNYQYNHEYHAYFNNLNGIVREAIDAGVGRLDLGQTAEIPKLRIGGHIVPKALFLYHRNPVFRWLIQQFRPFIEYRKPLPDHRVFKQSERALSQKPVI